jgi:AbiTii
LAGLVQEIQTQALDPTVRVTDLLRKVKLAAVKLKLTETIDWVEHELRGYLGIDDDQVPTYRRGHGTLMQNDQFGSRVAHGDTMTVAALSQVFLREPISSLEALANSSGNTLIIGVDPDIEASIKTHMGLTTSSFSVTFGKSMVISAIDRVRDLILDWSVALEQQGILGEGISFTMEEKDKASIAGSTINIQSFQGHLGNVTGDQNRTNVASLDSSVNTAAKETTFTDLSSKIEAEVENAADRQAMLEIIKQMQVAKDTKSYSDWYAKLVGYTASYVTILGPFLPALAGYIPG